MANSRAHAAVALLIASTAASAEAQQAQGFALERLYPAPAGAGWFVMDELNMPRGFGGAIELTSGYAHNPLTITQGSRRIAVITDEAFASFSAAVSYDRFRLSLNLPSPLTIDGHSVTADGVQFSALHLTPGNLPDTIADPRIGFDARIFGEPGSPLRLGASAQLVVPVGSRADFDTDGTVRGMFRLLAAGDAGRFIYAAQLGVHVRPLNDAATPGAPRGSELLFGIAAGGRVPLSANWTFSGGPEIFGETAFTPSATGIEALASARFESSGTGPRMRVKLGAGGGLAPQFGTPEWRVIAAVELFAGNQ